MQTIAKHVLEHAIGLPEGTPLVAKELLHLGKESELGNKAEDAAEALCVLAAGNKLFGAEAKHSVVISAFTC